MTHVVWFRQDLRLADNPALTHAARQGPVIPLFILDETPHPKGRPIGAASRWWLHHSLTALARSLGGLTLLRGDASVLLPEFVRHTGARGVFWNRCYEPYAIARDTALKAGLEASGLEVASFNASLLHEPWQVRTQGGGPFKVFSPFWRACLQRDAGQPLPAGPVEIAQWGRPGRRGKQPGPSLNSPMGDLLADWALLPARPNWAHGFETAWTPGEAGARTRLTHFLEQGLAGYRELRDRPDLPHVSRLSPHLHWGEISPRQIWAATHLQLANGDAARADGDKFLAEIGWREFAHHLLHQFPQLAERNWRAAYDAYPWQSGGEHLVAWQRGQTGYPIVDAGLRELWATGTMHNRVRMIAASFLVKHLRIDWRKGEAWFWDTLVDADLANNAASWQWVAGSGADAAPYFRIFNPMEQGRRFDPGGDYVRRWCPELARLPDAVLHAPFEAHPDILAAAGVRLGQTYPLPIVDHKTARLAALAGYDAVKAAAAIATP